MKDVDKYHYIFLSLGHTGKMPFQVHNVTDEDKKKPYPIAKFVHGSFSSETQKVGERL